MSQYVLFSQGICFLAIAFLFVYTFKKYPMKKEVKPLVYASLFVVSSVALNALSLTIPFFGVPSVKVGFTYLPLLMCGFFLQPSYAFLVGFAMDVIGLLITPTEYPFLGFTLNHIIAATLPAIFIQKSKQFNLKKTRLFVNTIFIGLASMAILYLAPLQEVNISGSALALNVFTKIGIILYIVMACTIMIVVLQYIERKISVQQSSDLAKWMLVVVFAELLINMILTPLYLDIMYGIPMLLSLFIRVVKASIMVGLNVFIGYSVIRTLQKIIKV